MDELDCCNRLLSNMNENVHVRNVHSHVGIYVRRAFLRAFEFPHVKTHNIATGLHAASQRMCDVAHTTPGKNREPYSFTGSRKLMS